MNLILKDRGKLGKFVRYMQLTADYFMHSFVSFNDSYNIFFYDFPADDALYVKIIPRFLTNPLYVGYMIPPNRQRRPFSALHSCLAAALA